MANRAIKYRIYPTTEQAVMFAKTFGCCRKVWNLMLADKIKRYAETKSFGSQTPAMYKNEYPYLKEVDSLALANVQMNLQTAFRNCFDKSRKACNEFPKFKSAKRSRKSYTTNNQNCGNGKPGTIAIVGDCVKLPKVGLVKAKIHRTAMSDWVIKSATVSQDADGKYYVSVLYEFEQTITQISVSDNVIGLDYKSDGLYMDSNGNLGSLHKYYRESQEKLAKAQRKLSRKVGSEKGELKSKNYLKQQAKVNKIHKKVANQRKDNLHKLSTEIANQYDCVCAEDLNMKNLSNKSYGNGKATMDNGYGMLLNMLSYKLQDRGKYFITVDKWYPSSQLCHNCGTRYRKMKDLNVRTFVCDNCGLTVDRDINAAINIKQEGLRLLSIQVKASA